MTEGELAAEDRYAATMDRAFQLVVNKDDWKAPIDAWIRKRDLALVLEAIEYYTATVGRVVEELPTYCHVVADGYRNGPAGP